MKHQVGDFAPIFKNLLEKQNRNSELWRNLKMKSFVQKRNQKTEL